MSRYFTRASAIIANPQDAEPFSLYDLGSPTLATQVFETAPRYTGLLDQDGNEIWASDAEPIGFQVREI